MFIFNLGGNMYGDLMGKIEDEVNEEIEDELGKIVFFKKKGGFFEKVGFFLELDYDCLFVIFFDMV